MKKLVLLITAIAFSATACLASSPGVLFTMGASSVWPEGPSFIVVDPGPNGECTANEVTITNPESLKGGNYMALSQAVQGWQVPLKIVTGVSLRVQSVAVGGARSFDIPGTNLKGVQSQWEAVQTLATDQFNPNEVVNWAVWIGHFNDCFSSVCTDQEIEELLDRKEAVMADAYLKGIPVLTEIYPSPESLNAQKVFDTFGIVMPPDAQIQRLKDRAEARLCVLPGVTCVDVWKDARTFDGLHVIEEDMLEAGFKLYLATVEALK